MTGLETRVREAIGSHPAIRDVQLVGSRARGDFTEYSDWDFGIATEDVDVVCEALPSLTGRLDPIAAFWDPLAHHPCYMAILSGPVKVDFLLEGTRELEQPYVLSGATLPQIDVHFWDWSLWLTSKAAHRKDELVRAELEKMHGFLLSPMGVSTVPRDLGEAVDRYVATRDAAEARFGVELPRRLASEVEPVVRRVMSEV